MDQNNQNSQGGNQAPKETKKITTTVTCPHCGKTHEVEVEVPESQSTPKMAWEG
ncbi:MAG TPA: hypothetical protein VF185_03765 [Patescibacteria group bacterium]